MKLAYLVSRFPVATETFILRELDAVEAAIGTPVELCSLFPAPHPFVHPAAERWTARVRQGTPRRALAGLAWALARRPRALAAVAGAVVSDHRRSPRRLARALATVPVAAHHARTLERLGVEHVHAHWATFPALAAWTVRRLTGIPYSITPHAHDIFIDQAGLGRLVDGAAFVVAISEYNRAFLRRFGSGRTPVPVVRYGIDVDRYAFRPRRPPASGPVRALCVASFSEYKGHRYLLEALALGGDALARVELDLVGRGALRDELVALASRLGLAERIRYHGTLTEEEVAARLDAADLFVLPSVVARSGDQEGLPNVILEALASGAPVVGTATAGTPELLREQATCLLAMPADPASLAAALEHVLAEPESAERRAVAGRALVERSFGVGRLGEEMAALLRAAGGTGQSRPARPN
jgi:glycosyltransferase involved in cell wall biosynthesis